MPGPESKTGMELEIIPSAAATRDAARRILTPLFENCIPSLELRPRDYSGRYPAYILYI